MEQYKIKDFSRDNPGQQFPQFQHIEPARSLSFCAGFAEKIGLPRETDPLTVLKKLEANAILIGQLNLHEFDLATLLNLQGIKIEPNQYVYIDWLRFDDIDRLLLSDVSRFFYDLWYSDDISIFDETLSWLVFVFHYKAITLVKF